MDIIFSLRSELLHPIFVHFPIALTVFTLLVVMGSFFSNHSWWEISRRVFLYGALMLLGFALFTGDFAEDAVKASLCNRHLLHEHEDQAYLTLYILIFALVLDTAYWWCAEHKKEMMKYIKIALFAVLVAANISLVITGHNGAELVYEQGAAVKNVTVDCSKFFGK